MADGRGVLEERPGQSDSGAVGHALAHRAGFCAPYAGSEPRTSARHKSALAGLINQK